jgi:hypothetical protein
VNITAGTHDDKWRVQDGLITVMGKVYVLRTSPSLPDVLEATHGMSHEGVAKMLQWLRLDFNIPDAQHMVHDFMQACATSLSISTQTACSSRSIHCPMYGPMSPWTSWRDSPASTTSRSS